MVIYFRISLSILILLLISLSGCNSCAETNCLNGGICNHGECDCPVGFEGIECETSSRSKYIGDFHVLETCDLVTFEYFCLTSPSGQDDLSFTFDNFYDLNGFFGLDTPIIGTVNSENSFHIPYQSVSNSTIHFNISGSGIYNPDGTVNVNYDIDDGQNNVDICNSVYSIK